MMFLSSLINAKVNLIAGMAIGVGMTMMCKKMFAGLPFCPASILWQCFRG